MVGEILKFELPEAGIWIPEIKNQQSIQKSLQNGYIQDCLEENKTCPQHKWKCNDLQKFENGRSVNEYLLSCVFITILVLWFCSWFWKSKKIYKF